MAMNVIKVRQERCYKRPFLTAVSDVPFVFYNVSLTKTFA